MSRRTSVLSVVVALVLPVIAVGQQAQNPTVPPIQAVKGVKPKPSVFKAAVRGKPLVIRSEKEAAEHFADADVATLKDRVDFKQQIMLVFAWRGSGQDRLTHTVAESYPEQVFFTFRPGRTRDLRPHVQVARAGWGARRPGGGRQAGCRSRRRRNDPAGRAFGRVEGPPQVLGQLAGHDNYSQGEVDSRGDSRDQRHVVRVRPWRPLPPEQDGGVGWHDRPCADHLRRGAEVLSHVVVQFARRGHRIAGRVGRRDQDRNLAQQG